MTKRPQKKKTQKQRKETRLKEPSTTLLCLIKATGQYLTELDEKAIDFNLVKTMRFQRYKSLSTE